MTKLDCEHFLIPASRFSRQGTKISHVRGCRSCDGLWKHRLHVFKLRSNPGIVEQRFSQNSRRLAYLRLTGHLLGVVSLKMVGMFRVYS